MFRCLDFFYIIAVTAWNIRIKKTASVFFTVRQSKQRIFCCDPVSIRQNVFSRIQSKPCSCKSLLCVLGVFENRHLHLWAFIFKDLLFAYIFPDFRSAVGKCHCSGISCYRIFSHIALRCLGFCHMIPAKIQLPADCRTIFSGYQLLCHCTLFQSQCHSVGLIDIFCRCNLVFCSGKRLLFIEKYHTLRRISGFC